MGPSMNLQTRLRNAARALFSRSAYEAAGAGPRWPVTASMAAPARQALAARGRVGQRAAWLVANAPLAESVVNCWVTNLVGDGPSVRSALVRSGHPNEVTRRALEDAWNYEFWNAADVEGGDLAQFLGRVVRALVIDGEAFVRMLATRRGELRLQLLNAEQIDPAMNRELDGGRKIVAGIELGRHGERLAYYVRPDTKSAISELVGPPVRIPAEEICHVYSAGSPGQVRGVSWFAPIATRLLELDSLEDAGLMKARMTALLCGFIKDTVGVRDPDDLAAGDLNMEPGTLRRVPFGQEVTFTPTSDMSGLNDFVRHMARTIGAGAGVPYELLTGDLSSVNYSSAKLGLEAFKRRCVSIRASLLGTRLLDRVWNRFVALEVLSGRLYAPSFERDPPSYFRAAFLWPTWAALDPYKEAAADVLLMRNGIRSRTEIVSARGRDIEDVNQEFEDDDLFEDMIASAPLRVSQREEVSQ